MKIPFMDIGDKPVQSEDDEEIPPLKPSADFKGYKL